VSKAELNVTIAITKSFPSKVALIVTRKKLITAGRKHTKMHKY